MNIQEIHLALLLMRAYNPVMRHFTISTELKREVEDKLAEAQKLGIHCPATWSGFVNEALARYSQKWSLARAGNLDKKTTIRLQSGPREVLDTVEEGRRSDFIDRVVRTWLRRHLIPAIKYRLKKQVDA